MECYQIKKTEIIRLEVDKKDRWSFLSVINFEDEGGHLFEILVNFFIYVDIEKSKGYEEFYRE